MSAAVRGAGGRSARSLLPLWHRALPPLRYAVPLALLVLGGVVGLYDYARSARTAERQVEALTLADLRHRMTDLQGHLEFLLRSGELERAREEVARLGADVNLQRALLLDDAGRIAASTRRELLGREAARLWPPLPAPAQDVAQHLRLGSSVQLSADRSQAVGAFPVVWGGQPTELWPSRVGVLVLETDLTQLKAQALRGVQARVLERMGLLALLALALWLIFHVALGRRVLQLVGAAERFAAG